MGRPRDDIEADLERANDELSYQVIQLEDAESLVSLLTDEIAELEQELAEATEASEEEDAHGHT